MSYLRTLALIILFSGTYLYSEVPTSNDAVGILPKIGQDGSATLQPPAGASSGTASVATSFPAGFLSLSVTSATGTFSSTSGAARTGLYFDEDKSLYIFDSLKSLNFPTVMTTSTTCPSSTTSYLAVLLRSRSPDLSSNGMDATAAGFPAVMQTTYEPSFSPAGRFSSGDYANLASTSVRTHSFSYPALSSTACSSAKFKINGGSMDLFDQFATTIFGKKKAFLFTGGGSVAGNPRYFLLIPPENLTSGLMTGFSQYVLLGMYSEFATSVPTRKNLLAVPNGSGTTFTLKSLSDLSDFNSTTDFGTISVADLNIPFTGAFSGTWTKNGVSGTGNIYCVPWTQGDKGMACVGQRPDNNSVPVSILFKTSETAFASISVGDSGRNVDIGSSGTITATIRNVSGSPIPNGLTTPNSGQVTAPLAYGSGNTCGATIPAFSSCTMEINYSPTSAGAGAQSYKLEYDDGTGNVVSTSAPVGYAANLRSIAISPSGTSILPGSSQQFTATGTYSDNSTQDITNAVVWTSSNNSIASINESSGVALFSESATGSVTFTAKMGTVSHSVNFTATAPTLSPATWSDVLTCAIAGKKTFTLSNPTSSALTGINASVTGSGVSLAVGTCTALSGASLAANSSCTYVVTATNNSTLNGTLSVSHSAGNNSSTIALPDCTSYFVYSIKARSGGAALGSLSANTTYDVVARITNTESSNRCFKDSPITNFSYNRSQSASVISHTCPLGSDNPLASGSHCDVTIRFTTKTGSSAGQGNAGTMSVSALVSPIAKSCRGASGKTNTGFFTISGTIP